MQPINLAEERQILFNPSLQRTDSFAIAELSGNSEEEVVHKSEKNNNHRLRWHFLTLGVPLLLETLSLFCKGLLYRDKVGLPLRVRFKKEHLSAERTRIISLFQKFNLFTTRPLNKLQQEKASQIINQTINACTAARQREDAQELIACQQKLRALSNLLEKNYQPKMTRLNFDVEDWKMLDLIDYELIREHCEFLTDLFNADWFKNSKFQHQMMRDFGINYDESVIAELLSFSLAYNEGLEGKSLKLPVYDKTLKQYRSVDYTIKSTRLGDDLPCHVLESTDPQAHPWFLIRGTQRYTKVTAMGREVRVGSFESMLADTLDHKCISRNIIDKTLIRRPIVKENGVYVQKESLDDIFRRFKMQNKTVNLCGHSLGGTLVNAIAIEFYDQVKTAYAFSGAGVSQDYADQWETLNNGKSALPAKLLNFDHEGDLVPSGGRCLIGTHVAIESLAPIIGENSIYRCHVRKHLCKDFQIQKVDVTKENNKFERAFCERIRIIIGNCLSLIFTLFSGSYLPDWWRNRNVYREHSHFHRYLRQYF